MKKTLLIFSLLCTALFAAGCDDLLDVTPKTDLTDAGFWKTEADLKGACNRLYEQLSYFPDPRNSNPDTRADDQFGKSANTISAGTWEVSAESADWTDPYKRIFTANNILTKGAATPVGENIRNRYLAEARFFRAYNYFDLVSKYGDVPLLLTVVSGTTDPALKMGRTPREEVIRQCYEDLEFAAEWLPVRSAMEKITSEFDRRRVTRSSALALMVRIGLHEGTMQKYHNLGSEAQWKAHLQKSIDAYTLLKAEGHALYTNGADAYQALFFDESNATNREILLAKAYGPNGGYGTGYSNHEYTRQVEGNFAITRSMVDYYLYANGLPREKQTLAPETSFNNAIGYQLDGVTPAAGFERDPRLAMTVWRINDPQEGADVRVGGMAIGWILCGKNEYKPFNAQRPIGYQIKKAWAGSLWAQNGDYTDRILIRWGEMLVSYAEALFELNGSITDAQLDETVNALRTRAGFSAKLTNGFASANGLDMREEIRRERTVELMAENRRYADIIRWKIAEKVLPRAIMGPKFIGNANEAINGDVSNVDPVFRARLTDATGKVGGVQEYPYAEVDIYLIEPSNTRKFNPGRDYYYPIPTFEIAQSDNNIKQNPQW
jgi:hypothetical protein